MEQIVYFPHFIDAGRVQEVPEGHTVQWGVAEAETLQSLFESKVLHLAKGRS